MPSVAALRSVDAIILGIETSNPSACPPGHRPAPGVAVARARGGGVEVLGREALDLSNPHQDDLLPAIDRVCRVAGLRPRDLGGVAVSAGPGGFTALRIATAASKMIAEATGALCWSVPTAHALALRVETTGAFAVALASKGETAWIARFADPRTPMDPGLIRDAASLEALKITLLVADSFLPVSIKAACERLGVTLTPPMFDAAAVIECALVLEPIDPAMLVPIYPREPEAVTKWRALHGEGTREPLP